MVQVGNRSASLCCAARAAAKLKNRGKTPCPAGYGGLFYLPATVAPIGLTPAGLPCGVQIMGPQYADLTCIHFARPLERPIPRLRAPAGICVRGCVTPRVPKPRRDE